jgi:S-adenosylmethionine:tRNA ribosyltransferase-isomerase
LPDKQDFRNIAIENYTYELPTERIAVYPLEQRDASNLLVYNHGTIEKSVFGSISEFLPTRSLMIFNNTRVVQARLLFQKQSGAAIEIFCLEPLGKIRDIQLAFQEKNKSEWFCLVGNAKKWKTGQLELTVTAGPILRATKGERLNDGYKISFEWEGDLAFAEVLELAGKTPLPPYLGRKAEDDDKNRYQTIFARHSGSVAAPTSGLHFTQNVLESLKSKGIEQAFLTLHVGAGTFKPVSSPTIAQHQMHHEQVIVSKETIDSLLAHLDGNIISVGTTSLRTLESLYWLGVKIKNGYTFDANGFVIEQWEPYDTPTSQTFTSRQAFEALHDFMREKKLDVIHGETSLIIIPGYIIRTAKLLITNFHQPASTLLLLVAAFCGENWKSIYTFALQNDFRFLSYGDSCLLFRKEE